MDRNSMTYRVSLFPAMAQVASPEELAMVRRSGFRLPGEPASLS
jgi:hypothetical protein